MVATSLFIGDSTHALIRPDFESEAYFGAGWHDPERTPTGRTRPGETTATLLLPLTAGFSYDLNIDVVAASERVDVALNGAALAVCERKQCDVTLPASAIRNGVNAVTLSAGRSAAADRPGAALICRGVRIRRRPT